MSASIISDGYHLPEDVLKVFYRVKGNEGTILISDVAPMGGLEPGSYKWKDLDVTVHEDGHLSQTGTPFLAGAGHMLDHCVSHFMRTVGTESSETLQLVTRNPKRLLDMDIGYGKLMTGVPANLMLFEIKEESTLTPLKTIIHGESVYDT